MARTNEQHHQDRCGVSFVTALALSWECISACTAQWMTAFTESILRFAKTSYMKRDVIVFLCGIYIMTEYLPKRIFRHCQLWWTSKQLPTKMIHLFKLVWYLGLYTVCLQIFVYWTIFKLQSLGVLNNIHKNEEGQKTPVHLCKENFQVTNQTIVEEYTPENDGSSMIAYA